MEVPGERHELLTPGEYTQLTGAGRAAGIDQLGHAVVVYQRQVAVRAGRWTGLDADLRADLVVRPSYNMAVNLVQNYTRGEAHHLLNSSFAQFLADRGSWRLERQRERDREALEGYRANLAVRPGGTSRSTGT